MLFKERFASFIALASDVYIYSLQCGGVQELCLHDEKSGDVLA